MGPLSRFEKIEAERPPREPREPEERERFLATEAPRPLEPPSAPATRVDGAEPALRTADGELDRLPTLACAVCGEESSKFSTHCRSCGSRLDTEEGRALNLERLARFDAEAAAQRAREAERLMTPGPGEVLREEPLAPAPAGGFAAWPRWAQVLAVAGVTGLLFPRLLLLFALPGLGLWLGWYFLKRPFR